MKEYIVSYIRDEDKDKDVYLGMVIKVEAENEKDAEKRFKEYQIDRNIPTTIYGVSAYTSDYAKPGLPSLTDEEYQTMRKEHSIGRAYSQLSDDFLSEKLAEDVTNPNVTTYDVMPYIFRSYLDGDSSKREGMNIVFSELVGMDIPSYASHLLDVYNEEKEWERE